MKINLIGISIRRVTWAETPKVHPIGVESQNIKADLRVCHEAQTYMQAAADQILALNEVGEPVYQNQEGNDMSRRTVTVQLIDPDKGLDVAEALVKDFGLVVTEDDDATTIQDLILEHDVAGAIADHNKKRAGLVNLDIKNRTGNEVKLDPVKLKQLKFIIK